MIDIMQTHRKERIMPNRMTPTEIRAQARVLYNSEEAWPLLEWLNQWRDRKVAVDASSVVQLVHAYTNLIRDEGPRGIDLGAVARRPYAKSSSSSDTNRKED